MLIGLDFCENITRTNWDTNQPLEDIYNPQQDISNYELLIALEENTEICRKLTALLEQNNFHTEFLYEKKKVDLTTAQMTKNFGLSVLSNIVGDVMSPKK